MPDATRYRPAASKWVPAGVATYGLTIMILWLSRRVSNPQVILLVSPGLAVIAMLRPGWVLLAILAIPPSLMAQASISLQHLTMLLAIITFAPAIIRGRSVIDLRSPFIPLFVLFLLASVFRASGDALASQHTASVLSSFVYLGFIGTATYVIVVCEEITRRQFEVAILVSVTLTALILLAISGFNITTLLETYLETKGYSPFEIYRTHFGFLMAIGLGVAATRPFKREAGRWIARFQGRDIAVVGFLLVMIAVSLTRGAWLCAAITAAFIAVRTGHRRYLAFPLIITFAIMVIPLLYERAFSDVNEGIQQAVQTGRLGSGRWGLWQFLWDDALGALPWGHGFGYTWTLEPRALFGNVTVFVTAANPFVHPHNDFLFWLLELGVLGIALILAFWRRVLSTWLFLQRHPSAEAQRTALILGPILIAMLAAELLDNGMFMRPVAERFFAAVGFLAGTAAVLQRGGYGSSDAQTAADVGS